MRALAWRLIAWALVRPRVVAWLIARSKRTPYYPIMSRDGTEMYMERHWLFNPYGKGPDGKATPARWPLVPSIRVHHILRADDDGALHDHPWNARTIVLRGWYHEERPVDTTLSFAAAGPIVYNRLTQEPRELFIRESGYTGRVLFNSYHRISKVSPGGVYTLWFTWRYRGTWGFKVNGVKIPYYEYLKDDS